MLLRCPGEQIAVPHSHFYRSYHHFLLFFSFFFESSHLLCYRKTFRNTWIHQDKPKQPKKNKKKTHAAALVCAILQELPLTFILINKPFDRFSFEIETEHFKV